MNTCRNTFTPSTRRDALRHTAAGFGWLAFSALAAEAARASAYQSPLAPRPGHFAPRAKRVIFLFMQGGPSHLDTFDWKPELAARHGKTSSGDGAGNGKGGTLLGPRFPFQPRGRSGLPVSDLFPELSRHADDLCLLNGMHTSNAAHPQASIMLHTGSINFVRPSLGSWVLYGLGSESANLPGFVTINPVGAAGGSQGYGSSFLPASFQGTRVDLDQGGIPDIRNQHLDPSRQRAQIDLIQEMNRGLLDRHPAQRELEGVIQSYEMAYQMQSSVPEVLDLSKEPESVRQRYGGGFGAQCLAARRLAEAGVRFIQVSKGGWDQHQNLKEALSRNCQDIDRPIAALLQDLKDRDMLRDTLVVWGGEFGRSPQDQANSQDGRRHNNRGYTMWIAGGGVKGGLRHGATDDLGGTAVAGKLGTHDLHATILHLLGLDHTKLTYRYAGRDFRLTDVYGEVATDILA
jgi:hypothetical protein